MVSATEPSEALRTLRTTIAKDNLQRAEDQLRRQDSLSHALTGDPFANTTGMTTKSDARKAVKARLSLPQPRRQGQRLGGCECPRCRPALYDSLGPMHPRDTSMSIRMRGLSPANHPPWSLASRSVASFIHSGNERGTLRWGQLRALHEWATWWGHGRSSAARILRSLDLREAIPDPDSFFRKPIEVFNQLFFLGALPSQQIQTIWGLEDRDIYGLTVSHSTIVLNPQMPFHKLMPTALLCTILHEMIHAFLGVYSCHGGKEGCGSDTCADLSADGLGVSGHGRAWQYMAKSIEEEMPRILGIKGRLGREECAVKEVASLGFRPSACDMRSLYSEFEVYVRVHLRTSFDALDVSGKRGPLRGVGGSRRLGRRRTVGICERLSVM